MRTRAETRHARTGELAGRGLKVSFFDALDRPDDHGAAALEIFVGETDQHRHRPLYTEIVERAHDAGLAGATVLRGIEGYGASSHIHTTRILRLSEDLPVLIEIVDSAEQIERILPVLDEMVGEGMVTVERVEVIAYRGSAEPQE